MKTKAKSIFAVAAFLVTSSSLSAKQGYLNPGEGLRDPMHRAHCGAGWLAETMRLNNIQPSQLRRLHAGLVMLPECVGKAPIAEIRKSQEIITADRARDRAEISGRYAKDQETVTELSRKLAMDKTTADQALLALAMGFAETSRQLRGRKQTENPWRSALIGCCAGVGASCLGFAIFYLQFKKRMKIFPRVLKVVVDGKIYYCPSTTPEPTYACSQKCGQAKLSPKHLDRHFATHCELTGEVVRKAPTKARPLAVHI